MTTIIQCERIIVRLRNGNGNECGRKVVGGSQHTAAASSVLLSVIVGFGLSSPTYVSDDGSCLEVWEFCVSLFADSRLWNDGSVNILCF